MEHQPIGRSRPRRLVKRPRQLRPPTRLARRQRLQRRPARRRRRRRRRPLRPLPPALWPLPRRLRPPPALRLRLLLLLRPLPQTPPCAQPRQQRQRPLWPRPRRRQHHRPRPPAALWLRRILRRTGLPGRSKRQRPGISNDAHGEKRLDTRCRCLPRCLPPGARARKRCACRARESASVAAPGIKSPMVSNILALSSVVRTCFNEETKGSSACHQPQVRAATHISACGRCQQRAAGRAQKAPRRAPCSS